MVTDSWGRKIEYVRVSLTEACNFCCPYCRPVEITPESQTDLVSVEEWLVILAAFHHLGVRALRLTGGEPLLYPRLQELLHRVHETGWFEDISMTTNGSLLAAQAEELHRNGLDRLNISLDSVDPEQFNRCTGRTGQLPSVIAGIEAALKVGFKSVKINTVLMDTVADETVATWLTYLEKWDVVWRFIEYMPFQGETFQGPNFTSWLSQLTRLCGGTLVPLNAAVGADKVHGFGPATYYRLPNGRVVGFIFPMSHSYCDSCNRVRLTSDGRLRLCLLRDDEASLVSKVREGYDGAQLAQYITSLLQLRHEKHDGIDTAQPQRGMWRIGG